MVIGSARFASYLGPATSIGKRRDARHSQKGEDLASSWELGIEQVMHKKDRFILGAALRVVEGGCGLALRLDCERVR